MNYKSFLLGLLCFFLFQSTLADVSKDLMANEAIDPFSKTGGSDPRVLKVLQNKVISSGRQEKLLHGTLPALKATLINE